MTALAHVVTLARHCPDDVVSPPRTRVLLAVLDIYARKGRVTYDDIREALGYAQRSSCFVHLHALRDAGLVTWEDDKDGTMRPTVAVVPWSP